jgi:hypothetical protein
LLALKIVSGGAKARLLIPRILPNEMILAGSNAEDPFRSKPFITF